MIDSCDRDAIKAENEKVVKKAKTGTAEQKGKEKGEKKGKGKAHSKTDIICPEHAKPLNEWEKLELVLKHDILGCKFFLPKHALGKLNALFHTLTPHMKAFQVQVRNFSNLELRL